MGEAGEKGQSTQKRLPAVSTQRANKKDNPKKGARLSYKKTPQEKKAMPALGVESKSNGVEAKPVKRPAG